MTSEQASGDRDPYIVAAIGEVANPDNWRGLTAEQKADLQAEIYAGLTPAQRRTVDAIVERRRRRG
jgi:hypothetical protein